MTFAEGLALDCQLAHGPSSECMATTRTKILCHLLPRISYCVHIVVDSWIYLNSSTLVQQSLTHSFTYLLTLLVV